MKYIDYRRARAAIHAKHRELARLEILQTSANAKTDNAIRTKWRNLARAEIAALDAAYCERATALAALTSAQRAEAHTLAMSVQGSGWAPASLRAPGVVRRALELLAEWDTGCAYSQTADGRIVRGTSQPDANSSTVSEKATPGVPWDLI